MYIYSENIYSFSDSVYIYIYIYIFFFRFFSIIDYYKILNIVPVLYSGSLLFISFLCSHVTIFMPIRSFTHSFIHSKLLLNAY